MNGVCQTECISMNSGDSDMLLVSSGISWDDSTALLALANALAMLGPWSSYMKNLGGTIA
jgi:hypothetical protein